MVAVVALNVAANLALPALDLDRPEWLTLPDRPEWLGLPAWLGWLRWRRPAAKVVRGVLIAFLVVGALLGAWEQRRKNPGDSGSDGNGAEQAGGQ